MDNRFEQTKKHLITYSPLIESSPIAKAEGCTFTDEEGKTFLNMNDISCVLGYGHPVFTKKLGELVLEKTLAYGGIFSEEKERLIANFMKVTHSDFDKIFFAASGGETVDWSIKIARRASGKDGIISFHNALHGRSFAGAYISGFPARKEGFGSGLENIYFWEYPSDGRAFEESAGHYQDIAAVIIEPFQAIGGMASPSKDYWKWLRSYTEERGILLIFDEIQTGFGKTGSFFAYEETGIVPDILLAGKGMSNGFGLGALLMTKEAAEKLEFYELSGGSADNALMCSVVNLVFEIYEEERIISHVSKLGDLLKKEIPAILEKHHIAGSLRGKGLFQSLELPEDMVGRAVSFAKEEGILLGRTRSQIMLRPPLVITEEEIRTFLSMLSRFFDRENEQASPDFRKS